MINREMKKVQVLTYTNTVDAYGQKRQGVPTSRDVDMVCKIYSQTNVQDPRYVDVEMIGITKDKTITDANVVVIDTKNYNILYVIPSGQYVQLLMKRK